MNGNSFHLHNFCLSGDYSLITYLHIFVNEVAASSGVSIPFHAFDQSLEQVSYPKLVLLQITDLASYL